MISFFKAPVLPPKQQTDNNEEGVVPSWRRSGSFRNRVQSTEITNSSPTSMFISDISAISSASSGGIFNEIMLVYNYSRTWG